MVKSPVLLVLILFITLPLWIAAGGIMFGLIMGLIGAIFGMIGAVFGIFFGIIGGAFHFFFNKYVLLALVIIAGIIISKKSK